MQKPTRVRYGVLAFCCALSMITYLDRVCFGTVAPYIQSEFGLSETQKGLLFTAFALAYALFEVPTGWIGDVFGPRKTLIRIVVWWSFFTVMTAVIFPNPEIPWLGFTLLLGVRFLFGIGEAGAYPNIARAFHNWFPFTQRAFAKGTVWMAGRFAGGITTFIVLALMYDTYAAPPTAAHAAATVAAAADPAHPVAALAHATVPHKTTHWRHIFFIFGGAGIVWCVFFYFWFRDRPDQKASVNQAERDLIHGGAAGEHSAERVKVPWGKLMGSANLWILCAMYFCASYGWYFNITYLPGYLRDYYGETGGEKFTPEFWAFSLKAGMPLLLGALACFLGGVMSDAFIARTGNQKWGRRLFGVLGHGLAALCYFAAIFCGSSVWLFVLAVAFAAFFNDFMMGAAWASCIDIGKRYSGVVSGCMNTIGNLGGAAAGVLTGVIIDWSKHWATSDSPQAIHEATKKGWDINFAMFSGVFVIGMICWFFFDSTRPIEPDAPCEPMDAPPTI